MKGGEIKYMKKFLITGAAAGLLLMSAAGVFADHKDWKPAPLPTYNFSLSNTGSVSNAVDTSANTGYNNLYGGSVKGSGITTGAATSASNVQTQLNFNQFDCGCVLGLSGFTGNVNFTVGNSGTVSNVVSTSANTGYNNLYANGSSRGGEDWKGSSNGVSGSWITTGAANAGSAVSNVVNTNVFGTTGL